MTGPQPLRFNGVAVALGIATFASLALLYALGVNYILVRWLDAISPGIASDVLTVAVLVVGPYALYAIPGVVIGRIATAAPFRHRRYWGA